MGQEGRARRLIYTMRGITGVPGVMKNAERRHRKIKADVVFVYGNVIQSSRVAAVMNVRSVGTLDKAFWEDQRQQQGDSEEELEQLKLVKEART